MSLKDEIKYVKDELSSDEKLLENAFKLERFYKKYKMAIWGLVIALIAIFGGTWLYGTYTDYRLGKANDALLTLQKDPKNTEALAALKKYNPSLHALYSYSVARKSESMDSLSREKSVSSNSVLSDIVSYHKAVMASKAGDSSYYRDLSTVEKAYEALNRGEKDKARSLLITIGENSPLSKIAKLMMHGTIK